MQVQTVTGATRPQHVLNPKVNPVLRPCVDEALTLLQLKTAFRSLRAGHEIVSEGRPCTSVFVLIEGIAIRYRILRDGQRQILSVILPGDFVGVPSCFFETALYSIKTLTPAVILPIPVSRIMGLLETHPRVAARLFLAFASDPAVYAERLITVGRRTATERVAHFLLELFTRLRMIGLADQQSYRLPITQEMISDALGLSIPYVNRVLHVLRDDGLVRIKDQQVIIEDMDELSALADFDKTYLTPLSLTDFAREHA